MTRYAADQNKVVGIFESGAYANVMTGSTFWFGQVTDHSVDDAENFQETRYLGTATRSFDTYCPGPIDVTGTFTFNPVDMRMAFWALGSTIDVSGTTGYAHSVSQINSDVTQNFFVSGTGQDLNTPMCFTLEDSKQAPGTGRNFIRTIKGIVLDSVKITATEGEKVSVDVDYIGQSLTPSSGTTTSITDPETKPFLWSDCSLNIAGSNMNTATEVSFEINNNMDVSHYLGSSALGRYSDRKIAAPIALNRDYTLSVTMDLQSTDAQWLYEEMYKGGSSFNSTFDMNADNIGKTGSAHSVFYMSGCRIISMDTPSTLDGVNETTIEIKPQNVTGSSWDAVTNYNPWIPA